MIFPSGVVGAARALTSSGCYAAAEPLIINTINNINDEVSSYNETNLSYQDCPDTGHDARKRKRRWATGFEMCDKVVAKWVGSNVAAVLLVFWINICATREFIFEKHFTRVERKILIYANISCRTPFCNHIYDNFNSFLKLIISYLFPKDNLNKSTTVSIYWRYMSIWVQLISTE